MERKHIRLLNSILKQKLRPEHGWSPNRVEYVTRAIVELVAEGALVNPLRKRSIVRCGRN